MTDIAALSRLIENLIRLGTVAEVDHGSLPDKRPARVRVQSGELLTGWLPWTALRAGATRDWDPPTVGEQVVDFSPSGQTAQGIAITGLFSTLIPANGDCAGRRRRRVRQRGPSPARCSARWRHQRRPRSAQPPGNRSLA